MAYHKQRSHRIEELADAVFAIVMTLLVLDIRIPVKEMDTEMGIWVSLVDTLPKILTFVLSFSVAGQFWSIFINQFNYIHISDRRENLIGLFYLMFVSLLPFSTSFLSEHLWSRVAVGFYVFNLLLILSFHTLHWFYSYRAGLVNVEQTAGVVVNNAIMKRAKTAFTAYGIVAISCLFNSYLALASTILVHVIFTFGGIIEMLYWKRGHKIKIAGPILIEVASRSLAERIPDDEDQRTPRAQLS